MHPYLSVGGRSVELKYSNSCGSSTFVLSNSYNRYYKEVKSNSYNTVLDSLMQRVNARSECIDAFYEVEDFHLLAFLLRYYNLDSYEIDNVQLGLAECFNENWDNYVELSTKVFGLTYLDRYVIDHLESTLVKYRCITMKFLLIKYLVSKNVLKKKKATYKFDRKRAYQRSMCLAGACADLKKPMTFLTLNFDNKNWCLTDKDYSNLFNRFVTYVTRKYRQFSYVRIAEHGEKGGHLHFHVLTDLKVNRREFIEIIKLWQSLLKSYLPKEIADKYLTLKQLSASIDWKEIKNNHIGAVCNYLAKYVSKESENDTFELYPITCSSDVSRMYTCIPIDEESFSEISDTAETVSIKRENDLENGRLLFARFVFKENVFSDVAAQLHALNSDIMKDYRKEVELRSRGGSLRSKKIFDYYVALSEREFEKLDNFFFEDENFDEYVGEMENNFYNCVGQIS